MQPSRSDAALSKNASASLLNRLIPENNTTNNQRGTAAGASSSSINTFRPKAMVGSKSAALLPPMPGDEPVKGSSSVVDKVRAIRDHGNKSLSNSASATILSANPALRMKDNKVSDDIVRIESNLGFSNELTSTRPYSPQNTLKSTSGLNNTNHSNLQMKNSFIGSLNLSPQQLNDLFKVSHTFFYLSVKRANPNDPKKFGGTSASAGEYNDLTDNRGNSGSVYDLEVVQLDSVDKNYYFTLSKEGVTQFRGKVSTFTGLAQWEREYKLFHKIANINFFKVYKRWKVRALVVGMDCLFLI